VLIPCPHCGPREVSEFTYAGDATRDRPALDASQAEWCAYLYERQNPMGWHREHWQHTAGCRAVLVVERHTLTHEIRSARFAGARSVPVRAAEEEPAE
jgi:sarcosine oxidase subunit delta